MPKAASPCLMAMLPTRSAASIRLYHCPGARSLRVLWALRELQLVDYNLITMPFPPRFTLKRCLLQSMLTTRLLLCLCVPVCLCACVPTMHLSHMD